MSLTQLNDNERLLEIEYDRRNMEKRLQCSIGVVWKPHGKEIGGFLLAEIDGLAHVVFPVWNMYYFERRQRWFRGYVERFVSVDELHYTCEKFICHNAPFKTVFSG